MLSERRLYTKYDLYGFKFTCVHECSEWKYGVCKHCRSRHLCNDHVRPVYPSETGVCFPTETVEIAPRYSEDLGTYVHEFTEVEIIKILRSYHKDWNASFVVKGYRGTFIAHFISLYGVNGTCMEPVTKRNRPRW